MKYVCLGLSLLLAACEPSISEPIPAASDFVDLSLREKPSPITQSPWEDVVVITSDYNEIAPFFTQIGGFETLEKSDFHWVLAAPGSDSGFIRLIQSPDVKGPARPADSRAWDTGCYFSIMMRAKSLKSIIEDAEALGWTPLTEMAFLEFGPSKLNVVVLTHETGVRVQLYERLTTPLPEGFTPFERISRPFNIMQMVEDRDKAYDFFQQKLGFETFYYGPPYVSKKEEIMPIGIPPELTTTTPYRAGIVMPFKNAEWGRMEMISVDGMDDGIDYSDRCNWPNSGVQSVRFPVSDVEVIKSELEKRGVEIFASDAQTAYVKTPDGANIGFFQK